jgi:CHRD domain
VMQHKRARTMGRVGICLAFVSSILMLVGPASAAAESRGHRGGQFSVHLSGDELGDGGDRNGAGVAHLDFDLGDERVCYVLTWHRLEGAVTAFHLHNAPRYRDGGHWIDFFNNERFNGDEKTVASCVHADRWKIRAVLERPWDYYLNVHTTKHESGAIRGQLG